MHKAQDKKLLYIGGSALLFLLCTIIGVSVYNMSSENGAKKDQDTETTTPSSSENGAKENLGIKNPTRSSFTSADGGRLTASHRLPHVCATKPSAITIFNAGLLGIVWWLSDKYATKTNGIQYRLKNVDYGVAGVMLTAMVGYIVCFFYQHYLIADNSAYPSLAKDVGLFFIVSCIQAGIIMFVKRVIKCFYEAFGLDNSFLAILWKELFLLFISQLMCYYWLVLPVLSKFISGASIVARKAGQLFSFFMLTCILLITDVLKPNNRGIQWPLLVLFIYCFCVQACWEPRVSFGDEKVDSWIAYLLQNSDLWVEVVAFMCVTPYLDHSVSCGIGSSILCWVVKKCVQNFLVARIKRAGLLHPVKMWRLSLERHGLLFALKK